MVVTLFTWSWAYQEDTEEAIARAIASKACSLFLESDMEGCVRLFGMSLGLIFLFFGPEPTRRPPQKEPVRYFVRANSQPGMHVLLFFFFSALVCGFLG